MPKPSELTEVWEERERIRVLRDLGVRAYDALKLIEEKGKDNYDLDDFQTEWYNTERNKEKKTELILGMKELISQAADLGVFLQDRFDELELELMELRQQAKSKEQLIEEQKLGSRRGKSYQKRTVVGHINVGGQKVDVVRVDESTSMINDGLPFLIRKDRSKCHPSK